MEDIFTVYPTQEAKSRKQPIKKMFLFNKYRLLRTGEKKNVIKNLKSCYTLRW